eukprot:267829_1
MNMLFWDPALEKIATDYAKTCPGLAGNPNIRSDLENAQSIATFTFISPYVWPGENIRATSLTTPAMTHMYLNTNYGILGSIDRWYNEAAFYSYDDRS